MKAFLIVLFAAIFLWMVGMTTWVSLHKSLLDSGTEFSWAHSPWSVATLFDAYFGFITFFVWVYFKERTLGARLLWFVLVIALGNIAMSAYMLRQLFKLKAGEPVAHIFRAEA